MLGFYSALSSGALRGVLVRGHRGAGRSWSVVRGAEHRGSRYIVPNQHGERNRQKPASLRSRSRRPEIRSPKKKASPEKPSPEIIDTASAPVLAPRPKSLPKSVPLKIATEVPRPKTPERKPKPTPEQPTAPRVPTLWAATEAGELRLVSSC